MLRRDVETVGARAHRRGRARARPGGELRAAAGEPDDRSLLRSLNALAGPGIVVTSVRRADAGFSARVRRGRARVPLSARARPVPPLFLRPYAWWVRARSTSRRCARGRRTRRRARLPLVLRRRESAEGKRTVPPHRLVEIAEEEHWASTCMTCASWATRSCTRWCASIVGTLVEVGRGRRRAASGRRGLEACDRAAAGPTAPAHGLTLWRVDYPEDVLARSGARGGHGGRLARAWIRPVAFC